MSELKSATLTPICNNNDKHNKSRKTFRLSFNLSDPSDESCSVFDYGSIVEKQLDEDERKGKTKSFTDLGAGYDVNDPFIDNTEADDEELKKDQETPYGGYYVNNGPLELKKVYLPNDLHADDFGKRKNKRLSSVIEEDNNEEDHNEEEDNGDVEEEEEKESNADNDFGEISEARDLNLSTKKSQHEVPEVKSPPRIDDQVPVKKKRKRIFTEDLPSSEATLSKTKKVKTVKVLLEEKRGHEIQSSGTSTSEDSNDGNPNSEKLPPPMPDDLSPEIITLVENISTIAAKTDNTRKTFCTDINVKLAKLEWKCRDLSCTNRNSLFEHLAFYLPCTKDTLLRRAKKLFLMEEENRIESVMMKLKDTINATLLSIENKHEQEHPRLIDGQNLSSNISLQNPETVSTKLPKFAWTSEIRSYLKEILKSKKRCYKVLKPRKSNYKDYINNFISTNLLELWPPGRIKVSSLLRECNISLHSGKARQSPSPNHSRLNLCNPSPSANVCEPTTNGDFKSSTQILPVPDPISNFKNEKPESFSMECLISNKNENSQNVNSKWADSKKVDIVPVNGVQSISVNSSEMDVSESDGNVLDLSSVIVSSHERTAVCVSDKVSLNTSTPPYHKQVYI